LENQRDPNGAVPRTGPAEVFAAHFQSSAQADIVRAKIESMGYDPREISYISDPSKCDFAFDGTGTHWAKAGLEGLAGGGIVGAGVSAGISVLTLGSIVVLGPIGIAVGAATGTVIGVLLGAGLSSDQAVACENAVNGGSLVMTVQAHAGDQDRVRSALGDHIIAVEDDRYLSGREDAAGAS
jgi:hypothetical protein